MKNIKYYLTILISLTFLFNINAQEKNTFTFVNTSHLDYLYQKINVAGKEMGIIHIYSDYPDYKYVEANGEGIACVDDAARALVFYIKYYNETKNETVLEKIKMLTNFLIYMQSDNGFFYNFIWKDFSKDTTYKTSVAEPNWWTWRAIWGLGESQKLFSKKDKKIADQINPVLTKAVDVTLKWLKQNNSDSTSNFSGFNIPTWLPYGTASDQAAILVKGLLVYYKLNRDPKVKDEIIHLCNGIIGMQAGDDKNFPYYAFLSWQNSWHMWGNSQADALIEVGKILHKQKYIQHAEKEIKYFYPYLMKKNYVNNFTIEKISDKTIMIDSSVFAQIAYGIRPMVFACIGAYNLGHNKFYAETAGEIAAWLFGKNINGKPMYNPQTGVCFDGIISAAEINKNSGAESTIEALLTLISIDKNPIIKKILLKYYNKNDLD
ncbi:MAG: hypothetical protein M1480_11600 [Bacteroidetes bacterium]|nr:hypothetical protein [Bacteroidota bacterium]